MSGPLGGDWDSLHWFLQGNWVLFSVNITAAQRKKRELGGAEADTFVDLFLPTALLFLSPKSLAEVLLWKGEVVEGCMFPSCSSLLRFLFTPQIRTCPWGIL